MKNVLKYCGLLFSGMVILYSCTTPARIVSKKPDTIAITIDGNVNDWGNNFLLNRTDTSGSKYIKYGDLYYDKNTKLQYSVTRDEKSLYVCLRTKDDILEKKIKTFGLTLWIDTTGKRKEKMGIRFPLGNKAKNVAKKGKDNKTEKEDNREFIKGSKEMEVKGFPILKDYGNEFARLERKSRLGIQAAIDYDTLNTMIYEMKIPYSIMYQGKTPENISLKFVTGNVDVTSRRDQFEQANSPGKVTTGMAGYATGGGGNLASVPGNKEYFNLMEPIELKININLGSE